MNEPRCESCQNCRFWEKYPTGSGGDCRRHPPQAFAGFIDGAYTGTATVWPVTDPSAWCGEFEAKKTTNIPETTQSSFRQNMP